jgi:hypothetical protein
MKPADFSISLMLILKGQLAHISKLRSLKQKTNEEDVNKKQRKAWGKVKYIQFLCRLVCLECEI